MMDFLMDFRGRTPTTPSDVAVRRIAEPALVPVSPSSAQVARVPAPPSAADAAQPSNRDLTSWPGLLPSGPPPDTVVEDTAARRPADDTDDDFLASLCEQIEGLYRAHQAGRLHIDGPVRLALEQAGQILAAVGPASVSGPKALRAKAAADQTAELLASLAECGEAHPTNARRAGALGDGPPLNQSSGVARAAAAAEAATVQREAPRLAWVTQLVQRLNPTLGSRRRPGLVIGAVMAIVAVSLTMSLILPSPNAGDHATTRDALTSQNVTDRTSGAAHVNHLSGQVAILVLNTEDKVIKTGQDCQAIPGYSDVRPGGQVTLTGGDGRLIATGRIGQGSLTSTNILGAKSTPECRFPFDVAAVPYSAFYTVRFWGRRPFLLSYQELVADRWSLSITLGKNGG